MSSPAAAPALGFEPPAAVMALCCAMAFCWSPCIFAMSSVIVFGMVFCHSVMMALETAGSRRVSIAAL